MTNESITTETQSGVRRSSRIQVNSTKRKNEEVIVVESQKKSKKESKQDAYFSIFSKDSGKRNSKSDQRKSKPAKKSIVQEPVKAVSKKDVTPKAQSDSSKEAPKKDIIDLVDEEISPIMVPKAVSQFVFVSSFLEQEIPVSTLPNHVQQAELINSENTITNFNLKTQTTDFVPLHMPSCTLRNLNSYFCVAENGNVQKNDVLKTEADPPSDDHNIWTEKYKPKNFRDISGNLAEVEMLVNWLKLWKDKLKPLKAKSDDSNSCSSYDLSEDDDGLLKCVVLAGRSGMGKTSAVHAISEELGFKVFEVNPSTSRIGRHVLHQLQEATLSHRVEGVSKMSPLFAQFTKVIQKNASSSNSLNSAEPTVSPKTPKIVKESKPKPGAITNFFKKSVCINEEQKILELKPEPKQIKKSTLLNFFKPKTTKEEGTEDKTIEEQSPSSLTKESKKLTDTNKIQNNNEILTTNEDSDKCEFLNSSTKKTRTLSRAKKSTLSSIDENSRSSFDKDDDEIQIIGDLNATSATTEKSLESGSDVEQPNTRKSRLRRKRKVVRYDSDSDVSNDITVNNKTIDSENEKSVSLSFKQEIKSNGITPSLSVVADTKDTFESNKLKISSLSVILFDDADVNLEPDEGFWSAINSFLKVTRKPVILTSSQNVQQLCDSISSDICVINFDGEHKMSALEHLKMVAKNENLTLSDSELSLLLQSCRFDLRQCVLQLQFWRGFQKENSASINTFGFPLHILCLNNHVSENIFKWFFDKPLTLAAEMFFSLHLEQSNLLHDNIALWLPFRKTQKETTDSVPKLVKKRKRILDTSWLSDEGSDDDGDKTDKVLDSESTKTTIEPAHNPLVQKSLNILSHLYDNLADADLIYKQDYKTCSSFWQDEKISSCNPYSYREATDMASWLTLLSAKHCTKELQSLPVDNIQIFNKDLEIVSKALPACKFNRCQFNIASSVFASQLLNHSARASDYFPMMRTVCKSETLRKATNQKRSHRFLHYFKAAGLNLEMDDLNYISNAYCE